MTATAVLRPPVPLGRRVWAETWRLAVAASTGILVFGAVWSTLDTGGWSEARLGATLLLDLVVGLAALVLVPFRHRAPLLIAVLVLAGSTVSTFAIGAAVLALVSLVTRRRPIEIAIGSAVFLVSSIVGDRMFPDEESTPFWQVAVAALVFTALLVVIGIAIGQRRALVQSLRERAALLEREQRVREDRAREQERAHLAREMHDVLGHRLSLVALHAGALEYRGRTLSPDETVAAAGVVRAEAHSALTELRDVLGVLREPDDGATTAGAATSGDGTTGAAVGSGVAGGSGAAGGSVAAPPQPTLRDLPALLDEAHGSGAAVTASIDDGTADVPAAVGRHAYRVVQEALTNARRHAPGQPVEVTLRLVAGPSVLVRVTNPLPPGPPPEPATTPGHGLRGLAERARLLGGSFHAGADGDQHVVEAVFPWTA